MEEVSGVTLDHFTNRADRRRARRQSCSPYPPPAYGTHHRDRLLLTSSPPPQVFTAESLHCDVRPTSHSRPPSLARRSSSLQQLSSRRQDDAETDLPSTTRAYVMLQRVVARNRQGRAHDEHIPSRCLAALASGESPNGCVSTRPQSPPTGPFTLAIVHEWTQLTPNPTLDTMQRRQTATLNRLEIIMAQPDEDTPDIHVRRLTFIGVLTWDDLAAHVALFYDISHPLVSFSYSRHNTTLPSYWAYEGLEQARDPIGLADMLHVAYEMGSVEFAVLSAMAGGGHAIMGFGTLRFSSARTVLPGIHAHSAYTVASIAESIALRHTEELRESIARSGIRRVRPTNRALQKSLVPGAPQVPDALGHNAISQNQLTSSTMNDGTHRTSTIHDSVRSDPNAIRSTPLDPPS
ncbi:uncharacterized protein B0H18DRAFT_1124561 [Fomitopsis serialis]|uniref:uncharacterized protein n=1 Tax=Fomitopsis serialis TaxID=139415 RepID=UPI0020074A58|nr:uncharacterized protein B0H18DRAFT_1124561 [Neoantrodia serialis]KAH9915880.1 hypothetical protein B0H18DRAFT_1124561 [Neoantrodia serialis]